MGFLLIIHLKAHTEHRIGNFVLLFSDVKESLAKGSTQIQVRPYTNGSWMLVLVVV
jgi:hypothetical protein